jgi:hypothetical protein
VQYVSITYTRRLADAGIEPSVGSVGDSFDNALAETVIGLFKTEVIRRLGPWRSLEAVEWATLALGLLLKAAASLSDRFAAARDGSIGTTIDASSSPSATSRRPRPKPATTTTWRTPPGRRRHQTTSPPGNPVRFNWNDPAPGFVEADLVAHSGPSTEGSFVQTVVLTDIATGWTECAPLLFREQRLLSEVLTVLREAMPFTLRGFDTDNDTVFINATVKGWCDGGDIAFTRSRPYRKNDQAHIEQKNGAVIRRMVGYRRLEGLAAAEALARLYRPMRLFVDFFQPSFGLVEKRREGGLVRKRYD